MVSGIVHPKDERLAIIHRLDKDTSGLPVFGKSPEANRSLTEQFARRKVRKEYLLLVTDRPVSGIRSWCGSTFEGFETDMFRVPTLGAIGGRRGFGFWGAGRNGTLIACLSRVGPTRFESTPPSGFPILWGQPLRWRAGTPSSPSRSPTPVCFIPEPVRLWNGKRLPNFPPRQPERLRRTINDATRDGCLPKIHGAADGFSGGTWTDWETGRWSKARVRCPRRRMAAVAVVGLNSRGVYFKALGKQVCQTTPAEACPILKTGTEAPPRFWEVRENGLDSS